MEIKPGGTAKPETDSLPACGNNAQAGWRMQGQAYSMAASTASANWLVPAVPPTSRVRVLRSA
jgi:hypothetical protein